MEWRGEWGWSGGESGEECGSGLGYRGGESSVRNVEGVWCLRGGEECGGEGGD